MSGRTACRRVGKAAQALHRPPSVHVQPHPPRHLPICTRQNRSQSQYYQYNRPYSSNAASASSSNTSPSSSSSSSKPERPYRPLDPTTSPPFQRLATDLSSTQPCFPCRGDDITLLSTPVQFHASLLGMVRRARRRIIISSLYIGTGPQEAELVDGIAEALRANPQLRVTVVLDYHRATRLNRPRPPSDTSTTPSASTSPSASGSDAEPPSSAHMLLPLLRAHPDRCEAWLYRSPKLRGLMERIVPERYDEGWGTWHGKWYAVDDEVILSGANLAKSYFTNRQDRYVHLQHQPALLSYLSSLTRLYTHYSYHLSAAPAPSVNRHYSVPLPSPSPSSAPSGAALIWPTPSVHPRAFNAHALATLSAMQNAWRVSNASRSRGVEADTWIWPVVQAGVLGVKEEERAMERIWDAIGASHRPEGESDSASQEEPSTLRAKVDLTSGYFGLYPAYKRAIIDSPAPVDIIAASPRANGFFGSKGLSRLIPEGYTLLEREFWKDCQAAGRGATVGNEAGGGVRLKEWERAGWTYHSKGLWISPGRSGDGEKAPTAQSQRPFFTFIGSSNLSTRSLSLDTELSLCVMTSSPALRQALAAEVKQLHEHAHDVGGETWEREDRRVSWLARILVFLGVEGML